MKMKFLLVALVIASLGVSVAVAAPPLGKGKPPTTGAGCKPKVTVVLKGTLAGVPLNVNVTSGNRWGRAYVAASQPVSIAVNADTKVRRQGKKTLDLLEIGDRVLVQARACKAELLAEGAPPALTAVRVVAHPASA